MSALPDPVGRQKEVLYLSAQGHHVVLGTAGSGKTTLAILRAFYLANPRTPHHGRTLLVTFNRCLVTYLENLADRNSPDVQIRNYHRFARGYLHSVGKMQQNCICLEDDMRNFCRQILAQEKNEEGAHSPVLERPIEVFVEEFKWLAQHGIKKSDDYVAAERVGRAGTRINRADRPMVFDIYQRYLAVRAQAGMHYDWQDLSHSVLEELQKDSRQRYYKHVVIDEGQDLSPMELRSLAAAIPENGSLTFFGDMVQQIYGNKLSWRNAGFKDPDIWRFEENYRNTKQISQLALALAQQPYFPDEADLVPPKEPVADGALPSLLSFASQETEDKFVLQQIQRAGETGTVAVLFRSNTEMRAFREKFLRRNGTELHRKLKIWPSTPGILYGTYHSAKGLEFDTVVLPHLSKVWLPSPSHKRFFGKQDAEARDARLLYVGITRARSNLILSYTGEITHLLPQDDALYNRSSA